MDHKEQFSFIAEWYDASASLIRRYIFLFHPKDGSIEMNEAVYKSTEQYLVCFPRYENNSCVSVTENQSRSQGSVIVTFLDPTTAQYDIKNHRTFLKRTKYEQLRPEDLFIGSIITVYARQLHLVGYGDQYTALKLGSKKQKTLGVLRSSSDLKFGKLIDQLYSSGLVISKAKMTDLTSDLLQYLTCGPAVALEILGDEAVSAWKKLIGAPNSRRGENETNVRAFYGIDNSNNAYGSECAAAAARELEIFFPLHGKGPSNTAKCFDCTLCIIKPHAIAEGLLGKILDAIEEWGFKFTAFQLFNVERANAEEFFEVYKGVVSEYNGMVNELSSGPCLALEFQGKDIQKSFRECCGPSDP
ncbi:nucleoside diphosphate kinase 7 isoform X2 [Carcharodon carcharias]|nr:nucleoside diphosphate kinase 7 isoform X2 [Carcharodon carcharias]